MRSQGSRQFGLSAACIKRLSAAATGYAAPMPRRSPWCHGCDAAGAPAAGGGAVGRSALGLEDPRPRGREERAVAGRVGSLEICISEFQDWLQLLRLESCWELSRFFKCVSQELDQTCRRLCTCKATFFRGWFSGFVMSLATLQTVALAVVQKSTETEASQQHLFLFRVASWFLFSADVKPLFINQQVMYIFRICWSLVSVLFIIPVRLLTPTLVQRSPKWPGHVMIRLPAERGFECPVCGWRYAQINRHHPTNTCSMALNVSLDPKHVWWWNAFSHMSLSGGSLVCRSRPSSLVICRCFFLWFPPLQTAAGACMPAAWPRSHRPSPDPVLGQVALRPAAALRFGDGHLGRFAACGTGHPSPGRAMLGPRESSECRTGGGRCPGVCWGGLGQAPPCQETWHPRASMVLSHPSGSLRP